MDVVKTGKPVAPFGAFFVLGEDNETYPLVNPAPGAPTLPPLLAASWVDALDMVERVRKGLTSVSRLVRYGSSGFQAALALASMGFREAVIVRALRESSVPPSALVKRVQSVVSRGAPLTPATLLACTVDNFDDDAVATLLRSVNVSPAAARSAVREGVVGERESLVVVVDLLTGEVRTPPEFPSPVVAVQRAVEILTRWLEKVEMMPESKDDSTAG